MHRGQDTAYYLRRGFRVVAIEAEPTLVAAAQARFGAAHASGQLTIVPCAVAERDGTVPFWVFPAKDEWNTLDPEHARRNIADGTGFYQLEVPCRAFAGILREHGIPFYLKIDIEGADLMCVRALSGLANVPPYLSLELTMLTPERAFEVLAQLFLLGYRRFKLVDQARLPELDAAGEPFELGMSGPFGEESPGRWHEAADVWRRIQRCLRTERHLAGRRHRAWIYNGLSRLPSRRQNLRRWRATITTNSWFDLHAALPAAGSFS